MLVRTRKYALFPSNTNKADLNHKRMFSACAFMQWGGRDSVIVMGGTGGSFPAEVFDLVLDTWTEVSPANNIPTYTSKPVNAVYTV